MQGVWSVCVIVLVLLGTWPISAEVEGDDREFWVLPDPGFVLLELESFGAQTGSSSTFTLYADGRLVAERKASDGTIFGSREHQVSVADVERLLEDLVTSGIMEYNKTELEGRMGPKLNTIYIADGSSLRLSVALQRYRGPGKTEASPAEVKISMSRHPFYIARHFPDIEEIQCLGRVTAWFNEYLVRKAQR